jgi:hypothetical protein
VVRDWPPVSGDTKWAGWDQTSPVRLGLSDNRASVGINTACSIRYETPLRSVVIALRFRDFRVPHAADSIGQPRPTCDSAHERATQQMKGETTP